MKLNIPKIVFEPSVRFSGITTISSDSYSISKMAAEYFIGLGFSNFAYCGFGNLPGRMEDWWHIRRFWSQIKTFAFFNNFQQA